MSSQNLVNISPPDVIKMAGVNVLELQALVHAIGSRPKSPPPHSHTYSQAFITDPPLAEFGNEPSGMAYGGWNCGFPICLLGWCLPGCID